MARGTQFATLVYMLRAELRRSTNVNVGVDDLPDLKQAINRQYAVQWAATEWPFLCAMFGPLQLNQGQQYYNLPAGLSYDRIKDLAVYFSGIPQRIERGISFADYALFDPNAGAYSDPVMKWEPRYGNASQEQIEVWPVPSSNIQTMRFFGYVADPVLVNDSDLCLLDDMLVVLFAAADCLSFDAASPYSGALPGVAQLKLETAKGYLAALRANMATGGRIAAIGMGRPTPFINTDNLVRVRG